MDAKEINSIESLFNSGAWSSACFWLKEIALQLALLRELFETESNYNKGRT